MKRIILAAALFSIFSTVLSSITASAQSVGSGCGMSIAEKLAKQKNLGENEKNLLSKIIIPEAKGLFKIREDRFTVDAFSYPILNIFGLGSGCKPVNAHLKKIEYLFFSCSVDGK
ncbi:hypothetical protein ME1_00971 [Bartonella vinsonii subsp. arupensis OK-94-513]|uniref:Uncharacterized protein n=2 Tax=Bartonella vinsonii subsp. arupensis TaxID=110578 RepID=J0QPX1_BARVI|nr:hypothetical protein [Bartonella vinsonii]EJF87801.1 hypothetical protein ME1_00971 [Bartonella vinsonii subsp. arupensis OK-94-513]EJF98594.1 hypothetical protein MEI_00417 [Bartonella vinsonii subsp. arupensis Pm136co]